jgi:K+-transporting ATPase ATPase A chain
MSYLVQMLGLTHQNFLSTVTIVLAVALIRVLPHLDAHHWQLRVDVTRAHLCCCRSASSTLFLVWQDAASWAIP